MAFSKTTGVKPEGGICLNEQLGMEAGPRIHSFFHQVRDYVSGALIWLAVLAGRLA